VLHTFRTEPPHILSQRTGTLSLGAASSVWRQPHCCTTVLVNHSVIKLERKLAFLCHLVLLSQPITASSDTGNDIRTSSGASWRWFRVYFELSHCRSTASLTVDCGTSTCVVICHLVREVVSLQACIFASHIHGLSHS